MRTGISLLKNAFLSVFEYLRWIVQRKSFPVNADGKVLVHIGVGDQDDSRYINIDARPLKHVHIVTKKIHKLKKIKSNSVDLVYMCHIMEHIPVYDISIVFAEMKRILKTGGVLRISVPDFDKIINVYTQCGKDIDSIRVLILGGQDYAFNFHYSIYNEKYLAEKLHALGFSNISQWQPTAADYYNFDDWASKKYTVGINEFDISLNIEATK